MGDAYVTGMMETDSGGRGMLGFGGGGGAPKLLAVASYESVTNIQP